MATKKMSKKSAAKRMPRSMPKEGKDPNGGLTAVGREFYRKKEGAHLKPGVTGAADTPEKMRRKGSFLTRHFTHPRGPMKKDEEPTRLALSAHAWGEPVPKTMTAAKKLAAKGRGLLKRYQAKKKSATKKAVGRKSAGRSAKG
jgi:hypothetical protein